ncbi:unnamed protein product [Closterium sp. Naga37s-1]|nr:unnamed protein product [Closterium sp. Naga37s-1]
MDTAMASSLSLGLSSLSLAPTAAIDGPSTARPLSFSASSLRGSALSLSASAPRQRAEAAFVCKAAYADVEGDQEESEEDIRAGYEALYGKPFGVVGVGVGKAKEVSTAVQKAVKDARRHMVRVPMTKYRTFPHRSDGTFGAASVMLRPAATGTGVIAGGAVRVVLELAGLENALGKSLGSPNPLNNARAVLDAVSKMKQFKEVSEERNIPMEVLWQ